MHYAAGEGGGREQVDCPRVSKRRPPVGWELSEAVSFPPRDKGQASGFPPSPFLLCDDPRLFTVIPNRGLSRGEGAPLGEGAGWGWGMQPLESLFIDEEGKHACSRIMSF